MNTAYPSVLTCVVSSCKKDVTPSIVNVTMLYHIDDVMKFKLATT